jgi:hypothetical protein
MTERRGMRDEDGNVSKKEAATSAEARTRTSSYSYGMAIGLEVSGLSLRQPSVDTDALHPSQELPSLGGPNSDSVKSCRYGKR